MRPIMMLLLTAGLAATVAACGREVVEPLGPAAVMFELVDPVPRLLHARDGDSVYLVAEQIEFNPNASFEATRAVRSVAPGGANADSSQSRRGTYSRVSDTLVVRLIGCARDERYVLMSNGDTLIGPQLGANCVGNSGLLVHTYYRVQ